jgi:hypothetical protein
MATKEDAQVRRQMRANGLAYRAKLLPELRGNGAVWRVRRGEAARDCGLKALDSAWTLDVMALRERFSADWNSLPWNRPIRGDPAGDDFSRELHDLCVHHRVNGLIIVKGLCFLPFQTWPHPSTRIPGGELRGRWHRLPPLLRLREFEVHHAWYLDSLRGRTARTIAERHSVEEDAVKKGVARFRHLIELVAARRGDPAAWRRTRRRAAPRESR